MPSNKTIKRRLTSVESTQKITKAMNMVAASRLQKNKEFLAAARVFLAETEKIIKRLKNKEGLSEKTYFRTKKVGSTAYLVITSNRGLCGGYNTNVMEKALFHMNEGKNEKIIVIGSKGYEYFKKQGKNILNKYDDVPEAAFYDDAEQIRRYLLELYTSGEVDEIYVVYTQFETVLTHVPRVKKILPIDSNPKVSNQDKYITKNSEAAFFSEHAIPMYLSASVYNALLESFACEQAARMISMDTSVNNASDILKKLTHVYNRNRQAAITQEISEAVSNTNISNQRG